MVDLLVVGIHDGKRVDVVALALRLGADALALGDRGGALGEILRRRRDVGIQQQAERDAPIGDAAFGIGLQRILEDFLRGAVPERMLIEHAAVEKLLRFRLARRLEMNLAELAYRRLARAPAGPATTPMADDMAIANDVFIMLLPRSASGNGGASDARSASQCGASAVR